MTKSNTPEWFSQVAIDFDSKYQYRRTFKERFAIWSKLIDDYSDLENHVLDIGCGTGVFAFYAAARNAAVVGVDGSSEMIKICNEKKVGICVDNISFIEHEISALNELELRKADMIICSSVLEYMDDIDQSISLLASLSNDDGIIMLSMPNIFSLYRRIEAMSFRIIRRPTYYKFVRNVTSLDEITRKLKANGFEILDSSYYAETPVLSAIFRRLGLSKFSDNLFVVVAQHSVA